jgi:hypothetical protein
MGVFGSLLDPFGLADCESELLEMRERYADIFFEETPFNQPAISPNTYLIVGRRGSGKTALSQYFSFQTEIPEARCLDVDEPLVFHEVLSYLSERAQEPRQVSVPYLTKIWEYITWLLIFRFLQTEEASLARAVAAATGSAKLSLDSLFAKLADVIVPNNVTLTQSNITSLLSESEFANAREKVLRSAQHRPIIIAVDTLEQYDVTNLAMMNSVAALIGFGSQFHTRFSSRGLHIKIFAAGEVFPYLKDGIILNPLKSIKHPVYLFWKPRDLLRLICWRLFKRLQTNNLLAPESKTIRKWTDYREIYEKMWLPYFGRYIVNLNGGREETFAYMLRHTQMRPRQLILLCNAVGNLSIEAGRFPRFTEELIREGVREAEVDLADEILNAYDAIYPNASLIVDALLGITSIFPGNELDRRAKRTLSHWNPNSYSLSNFRKFITELGVIGRVTRNNAESGYVDAEFEYTSPSRLTVTHDDQCVIHPMFYRRLNVKVVDGARILPFSTDRELKEVTFVSEEVATWSKRSVKKNRKRG